MDRNRKRINRIIAMLLSIILALSTYTAIADTPETPDDLAPETEATYTEPEEPEPVPEEKPEQQEKEQGDADTGSNEEPPAGNEPEEEPEKSETPAAQPANVPAGSETPEEQPGQEPAESETPASKPENEPVGSETPEESPGKEPAESEIPADKPETEPAGNDIPEGQAENEPAGNDTPEDQSGKEPAESETPEGQTANGPTGSETPEEQSGKEPAESESPEGQTEDEQPGLTEEDQTAETGAEDNEEIFPAFLKAGAVLYSEKNLSRRQQVLADQAVVLVLVSEENAAQIEYVCSDGEETLMIQTAWVGREDLQPLTEEELKAWNAKEHLPALERDGFVLEPVQFEDAQVTTEAIPIIEEENHHETDSQVSPPTGRLNSSEISEEETPDEPQEEQNTEILKSATGTEDDNTANYTLEDGELTIRTASPDDAVYENPNLPAVRDQDPFGTCWTFAATGAMEIDLIIDSVSGIVVDLSEFFLAYFAAHDYPYAKGGGEEDHLEFDGIGSYLDNGGNTFIAFRLLENLIGLVDEATAPYPETTDQAIPTEYTPITAQITGAYLLNTGDRSLIKQMILEHGAVSASVFMPSMYNESYSAYGGKIGYNSSTCSLYGTTTTSNHDILLVGWDDNYSKNNFISGLRPKNNGAWKVRNSWGSNWGKNGYFWVSYEDASLLGTEATAYDAINSNSTDDEMADYCYSYDKIPNPGGFDWNNWLLKADNKATVSQSFTIDGNEKILSVGTETGTAGVTINVSVRVGGRDYTGSTYAKQKGFYRIKLSTPCTVAAKTSAVVTVTYTASGKEIAVPYEPANRTAWAGDYKYTTSSGSGGFTFNGKTINGDACIKVYTRKENAPRVTNVTLSYGSQNGKTITISNATIGKTYQLKAKVTASAGADQSLRWSSSAPAVADVNQNGLVSVGLDAQAGTTVITAISADGVYATCTLTVPYVPTTGISIAGFNSNEFTIDDSNANGFKIGDTLTVKAKLLPNGAMDRDVVWSSSNSNVLEIKATGTVSGSNNPYCEVVFKRNGTARLTVSLRDKPAVKDYVLLTLNVAIPVSSITLNYSKTSLDVGETVQLNANVQPSNATNKLVTWSSSNTAVATVTNAGTVKAVRYGTAVITAKTSNGKKASCTVTVRTTDPIEAFVIRMYRVCLLREPDASGLAHWTGVLRRKERTGAEVAYGFYLSKEMTGRGYSNEQYITRAYEGIMGRTPDASGLRHWTNRLDQGVSYRFIVAGFVKSPEFKALCAEYGINQGTLDVTEARDQNPGITGFVSRLYQYTLGRKPDVSGLNHWCQKLLNDSSKTNFLNVALEGFLHSAEFLGKNYNDTAFVKILYRTFLGREAEETGLQHWLQVLQSGTSRDEVARRFAESAEFSRIMASYGIN